MVKKMPERIIADHQAAIGQLLEQSPQREIRLLGDPRQNPIPLARHKVRPVAAHFQRSRTANGALSLRPLHDAGDADHESLGHRPAGLARRHSPNHPLPQVQRIGSSHPSWPPIKSQQVEFDSRRFGNAPRFSQSRSRSSVEKGPLFLLEKGVVVTSAHIGHYLLTRRATLPIAVFTSHDLRRTFATMLAEMGIGLDLVAAIVGHKSGGKDTRTLVRHYVHTDMLERKAHALKAWDDRLNGDCEG